MKLFNPNTNGVAFERWSEYLQRMGWEGYLVFTRVFKKFGEKWRKGGGEDCEFVKDLLGWEMYLH